MNEKKLLHREISFIDPNTAKLINVFEKPMKDANTGETIEGSVEEKVTEFVKIKELREIQKHNIAMKNTLESDLALHNAETVNPPAPLIPRLAQLRKDIEDINAHVKLQNKFDAHNKKVAETKDHINRTVKAIEMCNAVFEKRREEFPDASIDSNDIVAIESEDSPAEE